MGERELVERIEEAVASVVAPYLARIEQRLSNVEERVVAFAPRRPLTASVKARHRATLSALGRRCPCCGIRNVLDETGAVLDAEYDHWYSRERRAFEDTWLICRPCHSRLTSEGRTERTVEFQAYQRRAARLKKRDPKPLPLFR